MKRETVMAGRLAVILAVCAMAVSGCGMFGGSSPAGTGTVLFRSASCTNADAFKAGQIAAQALKKALGSCTPKVVFVTECYEEQAVKAKALAGVASVFPEDIIVGAATYGSFTQGGSFDQDVVTVLGIGGPDVDVQTALVENMGATGLTLEKNEGELAKCLGAAGKKLATKLGQASDSRLMLLVADAHSPKNGLLIKGVQSVVGKDFPITGGSCNKNDGQTFVYFKGKMYKDAAVGVMLSGNFTVSLAGRQAKSNEKVISTAREGSAKAIKALKGKPIAMLAFNCAGRKGKLDNLGDELKAIQDSVGTETPIFGCYCAGEYGPADVAAKTPGLLSSGCGWHVMITIIGQ